VNRSLSRRDLLVSSAAALAACGQPKATAYPGYCFVANQDSRSVAVVDLRRFRVRKQIALDAAPSLVVAHPTAPKVFVLAPDAGTVYEIEAASLSVSRRARAGNQAVGMRMSPHKKALWILYRDPASLVELPIDSMQPGRRIPLSSEPGAFDLTGESGDPQRAAVACQDGTIVLASLDSGTVERTIATGETPSIVHFRLDGKSLIVGHRADRSLSIFDVPSGKTVVRLPLAVEPSNFCANSDGGQIFISGPGMDAVVIVFPYSTEIWQTVLAGRAPGAMAVTDAAPPFLLVANPETDSLTVLDVRTQKLVAVVRVGRGPGQILLTPGDQQFALVLNEQSGDLAVIRTYSLRAPQLAMRARFKSAPVFTMIPVGEKPVSAAVVALA
jgi:YVTN family beta-propeller protein